jgi:hypothetical protein
MRSGRRRRPCFVDERGVISDFRCAGQFAAHSPGEAIAGNLRWKGVE